MPSRGDSKMAVPSVRVLASPFPEVLERKLAEGVAEAKRSDPLAPVLVVVPSVRLRDRAKRVLASRLGAVLGVHVLYHREIAKEALSRDTDAGGPRLRIASDAILDRLLAGILDRGKGPLREYARRWRGARRALLGTLRDLRDARVPSGELLRRGVPGSEHPHVADLYSLYSDYVVALTHLSTRGLTDAAGFIESALLTAGGWASRFAHVFHHGAYDLIATHTELMAAIGRAVPLTWLVPAHESAPAFAVGRMFIERMAPGAVIDWLSEGSDEQRVCGRASALFDETRRFPQPLDSQALDVFHAQGGFSEASHAARLALGWIVDEGVAPDDIAIVARGIEAYVPALPQALGAQGVPFFTTIGKPLAAEPTAQGFLFLLRALDGELDRRSVVDLLRCPAFRGEALLEGTGFAFLPDLWDRWSRGAGVLAGRAMWVEGIAGWLGEREARFAREEGALAPDLLARTRSSFDGLVAILDALVSARESWRRAPRTWAGQADALRALAGNFLRPFAGDPDDASAVLSGLLNDLAHLDEVTEATEVAPSTMASPEAALAFLEELIATSSRRNEESDRAGVQVLDLMQARSIPFRRILFLGFNQGRFPGRIPEDPFLPDEVRRALRVALGRLVPVKAEAGAEDRALLGLLLAGTKERLVVGWQRANEEGKQSAPSLALREIARVRLGEPDLFRIIGEALSIPSHPREALDQALDLAGRLSFGEAAIASACGAGDGASAGDALGRLRSALGRADAGVSEGLRLVASTEAWEGSDLTFDGIVGRLAPRPGPVRVSVSALEKLGRCPLAFFFRHVLGVREMDEVGEAHEIDPFDMGDRVHDLLRRIYDTLIQEGAFALPADALVQRGKALLASLWDDVFRDAAARMDRLLPLLWEIEASRWRGEVETFLKTDLAALAASGARPVALEQEIEDVITLDAEGVSERIPIIGRLDRIVDLGGGRWRVGDYKTSGNPDKRIELRDMLRGRELQIPLYVRLARRWLERRGPGPFSMEGEILALGPAVDPDKRGAHPMDPAKFRKLEGGIEETVQALLRAATDGQFPMTPSNDCAYCAYRAGCRRVHPPSLSRLAKAEGLERLRKIRAKVQSRPFLRDVGEGGDE